MATRWQRKVTIKALKANTIPGFDCHFHDGLWEMQRLSDGFQDYAETDKEAVKQLKLQDVNARD